MKKDFLTITPESGGGTASVSAVADPNLLAKERSTTINFSATGGEGLSRAVTAIQDPAFAYQVHSNLILDNSFNKFKIENGVYLVPIDMNTTIGEKWKLVVYDPFSVITSITANITTIMVYTNILGMTLLSQVQPEQEKFGILNYYRVGQVNFQEVLAQQIFS